jgi:two-component system phosphate regulon sensor histidine kinase PhoR
MIGLFEILLICVIIFLLIIIYSNRNKKNTDDKIIISKYEKDDSKTFILDELEDQFIALDKLNIIKYVNPSAEKRFGKNILNTHLGTILRHPNLDEKIREVKFSKKTSNLDLEINLPSYQYYRIYVIPGPTVIFTEKDSVVLFLKDLTEISKAQKFRTDFVANVSHELKTPLVSIKGAIETIEGPAKDDEIAKINFLKIISSQSKRMENLISDLLILSRIELQEHIRPDKPVNLKNVLTKVKDIHFTSLKEKNINLEMNLDNVSDVIGDEDKLITVFSNLLDNAIKYSKEKSTINILASPSKGKLITKGIKISVSDQGIGIPEDQINRVTERFYRVDVEESRKVGGTGLGLAIVKHIISQHRGDYEIKNLNGKGTEINIHLPSEL